MCGNRTILRPPAERRGAMASAARRHIGAALSGLSMFALEAIAYTSGTISTKARRDRTSLLLATEPARIVGSDRFSSRQGSPRHQKRPEEILRDHLCPLSQLRYGTAFIVACTKLWERR